VFIENMHNGELQKKYCAFDLVAAITTTIKKASFRILTKLE
jgi:hypothetical protein